VQRRAAEVAARQRALAQEASKKRVREEPEAGPSGDRSDNIRQVFLFYFILFYSLVSLLTSWQVRSLCERDLEKPKQRACMKCTGLKERCEWPEVGGPGPVVDKGKGKAKEKEVVTSPRGGEKRKKKKTAAKVADDNNNIVEVPGPSGKRSGFDPGPFLERLDWLTGAVEEMTGQMRRVADATRSVARGNKRLMAGLETFLEECRFFTAPWDEDKELEDSEAEVDPEEVEQEVQGLHEEQENPGSGVPE